MMEYWSIEIVPTAGYLQLLTNETEKNEKKKKLTDFWIDPQTGPKQYIQFRNLRDKSQVSKTKNQEPVLTR